MVERELLPGATTGVRRPPARRRAGANAIVPAGPDAGGSLEATFVSLQRAAGNAAVTRLVERTTVLRHRREDAAAESFKGDGPDQPPKQVRAPDEDEDESRVALAEAAKQPAAERRTVAASFSGGTVVSVLPPADRLLAPERGKREVTPTGTVTYDGAAASSTCLPADILPADVAWDVVDKGTKWGVKVTSFTTSGEIHVNPTPNLPTTMTTPNTANPVDGGNIDDTPGSNNNWKFAVSEMRGYNRPGGGRSAHWHSTAASDAHEYAHWNTDWLKNVLGKIWPKANRDIDAITIRKSAAADAAAAEPLLKVKVDRRIAQADRKSTRLWNAVPDEPGMRGANGYKAGQVVLNGLISAVRAYARSKGWR